MILVEFRTLPSCLHPFAYLQRRFRADYDAYRRGREGAPEVLDAAAGPIPEDPDYIATCMEQDLSLLARAGQRC